MSPRRSTRARRQAATIYDEARAQGDSLYSTESTRSRKRRDDAEEEESEPVDEDEHMSEQEDEESDEDKDDDDFDSSNPRRRTPRKSAAKRKIEIRKRGSSDKRSRNSKRKDRSNAPPTKRAVHTALTVLAKKVLHDNETPENSLLASLLKSYQDKSDGDSSRARRKANNESLYTPQLKAIVRTVVQSHQKDPNQAQIDLLNLIFRSVGSSPEAMMDPEKVDLENISDEELGDALTLVVEDMEYTPNDSVLLCADPRGAVAHASNGAKDSLGEREYRKIFEEFWYQLGTVILADGTSVGKSNQDNDDESSDDESKKLSSSKFQVEMVRDIVSRLMDFVHVGVADIRAATTVALYRMGAAMLERTVELKAKVEVASRQLNAAKKSKQKRKKEALTTQIDSWKRTISELEDTVSNNIIFVFAKRYKDTNEFIRAESIQTLSQFTLIRPDLYLQDSYLKYFAWLSHDAEATVRERALTALLAPFREASTRSIDTKSMSNVIRKFLGRLCDCVIDADAGVQEVAMELFVILLREGFLDDLEDNEKWEQINLRAIQPDATPTVRYNALLFVLDQLDAFDTGVAKTDDTAVSQINALVDWVSHSLGDFDIPIKLARYDLTDLLVASLRAHPEHGKLSTNWSAMVRAIENEPAVVSVDDMELSDPDRRMEAIRQRVLLRFFVCCVEMEVNEISGRSAADIDSDLLSATRAQREEIEVAPKKKRKLNSSSHEDVTLSLLGALPSLLDSFKSEDSVMQSLTSLPPYCMPSVFNLSSRKRDFLLLAKKLSNVFLESVDSNVIQNCAHALIFLCKGDHARTQEAENIVLKTIRSLKTRLQELFETKKSLPTEDDDENDDTSSAAEATENSIRLCLARLHALSKRVDVRLFLVSEADSISQDEAIDELFTMIAAYLVKELDARKMVEVDDTTTKVSEYWKQCNPKVHDILADVVAEGTGFLLSTTAWRVKDLVALLPSTNDDLTDLVQKMRNYVAQVLYGCFEQFLEPNTDEEYTDEMVDFSIKVQKLGCRMAGDLRSLFPKLWMASSSPALQSLALTDEGPLIGGFVRFLRAQEHELRDLQQSDKNVVKPVREFLLSAGRGLTPTWEVGNRREAGAILAHIVGSGPEANKVVTGISRVLKKVSPIRMLEAHMACLRQEFDTWLQAEPDEIESDRPSEEELTAFEEAELAHKDRFELLEQQAARLSSSLGVGKLAENFDARVLFGFVREGVRYAFSTDDPGFEEELLVGTRLAFLRLMAKYLTWVRKDKDLQQALAEDFNARDADLRSHAEFNEIFQEDREALDVFRKAGGLEMPVFEEHSVGSFEGQSASLPERPSTVSKRARPSLGSSISSIRSKVSAQGSLSPLEEGDEEGESPLSPKEHRRMSAASSITTADHSEATNGEGSVQESESEMDE